MNIMNKVTARILTKNKVRTIVTIIGIILSAAMICAVTTFIVTFRSYLYRSSIDSNGEYFAAALNISDKEVDSICNDSRIEKVCTADDLGFASVPGNDSAVRLIGINEKLSSQLSLDVSEGRLPEKADEVVITDSIKYRCDIGIGDKIEVSISDISKKTFTVCGICYSLVGNKLSVTGADNIMLTAEQPKDIILSHNAYFTTVKPTEIYDVASNYEEVVFNENVLRFCGASKYENFNNVLYGFAGIVIFIIMLGSISLIYNAFSISVSERTKLLGIISSVGATRKQIHHGVISEALMLSLIGIPIGIAAGIGGMSITLKLIGKNIVAAFNNDVPFTVEISVVSIIAAAVIALITVLTSALVPARKATKVTAIEAIRQTNAISDGTSNIKTGKLVGKVFGFEASVAQKYYKRDKKKYRTTIISLFISIVLFITASSFGAYLSKSVSSVYATYGYDICATTSKTPGSKNFEAMYKSISGMENVTEATYLKREYIDNTTSDRSVYDDSVLDLADKFGIDLTHISTYITFIDDDSFASYLSENKLDSSILTDRKALIVNNTYFLDRTNGGKYYDDIRLFNDSASAITARYIEPLMGDYYFSYESDGNFHYSSTFSSDDEKIFSESDVVTNINVPIGALIQDVPMGIAEPEFALNIIFPFSAMSTVLPGYVPTTADICIRSDDHAMTASALEALGDDVSVYDYAENAEGGRSLILIINVFSYGFIILISLIAAANVFNTISTNVSLRRRELATLRSIGMTNNGLDKMMSFECLLYGTRSLLFGLPVSLLTTYLVYKVTGFGMDVKFFIPWKPFVIAVFAVFAVVFSTMLYAIKKVKKSNPIETLRNENI